MSSAAAALAEQVFGDLAGRSILLVGAGKISEQAARSLLGRRATIAFVANRTLDHAADLAERFGAEPLPLERLEEQLAAADVVVSSTSAPGYVLDAPTVERALRARRGRQLLLIDLAVPRDLDPAIHELDGCYLYDIDDLQAIVNETLAGRRGETERAEAIVAERVGEVPRVAGVARDRARDRVAARPGGGDPGGGAAQGRGPARPARREPAERRRGDHRADRRTSSSTCRPCA